MALRANGPDGVQAGIFGWANSEGLVLNERSSPLDRLGLVLPLMGYIPLPRTSDIIPPGYGVTLASAGDFLVAFPGGAIALQRVYVNPLDGTLVSGETPGTEPTPWTVMQNAGPDELTVISSWS